VDLVKTAHRKLLTKNVSLSKHIGLLCGELGACVGAVGEACSIPDGIIGIFH
jgi:hypothetical protein